VNIRRRLALWLCRQAGLTEIASTRAELDDIRAEHRKLRAAYTAQTDLLKTIARQTNSNTLMMKRWLEAVPSLQTVEAAHARKKSRIILPPTADLRAIVPAD
jgi:hypothetical protein